MPLKKKQKLDKKEAKDAKKRRRQEEDDLGPEDDDNFFLAEDDAPDEQREADAAEETKETAEEKRLRLAKAYLKQLRASGVADEEGLDEDFVLGDDELAEKLKQQAQEAGGYLQRQIAAKVSIPLRSEASSSTSAKLSRCHDLAVTALALTHDDAVVYSVGKEGRIHKLDVATGARSVLHTPAARKAEPEATGSGAEWVKKGGRQMSRRSLLAAAVSSDGQLLAVGGGDRKVHVWDTRTQACVQSYPGHKDAVTGLAFRHGTHELYSASLDRSIKIWSLDDRCYVDTLFGHQAEVLSLDALRAERVVSAGHDHSCRVWKVPEESQLIYRAPGMATDCCRYVTGTEWVTGSSDGALALWSQLRKKPAFILRNAHNGEGVERVVSGPEASWIQSVAVCRGSDLVASGAGDGLVRLWQVEKGQGSNRSLRALGGFPARGFVNSLALAGSGRFVVAGLGREQRLGRWATFKGAQTGILIQPLLLSQAID